MLKKKKSLNPKLLSKTLQSDEKSTPKKLKYKDYIKSPSGEEFPSSKTTAGSKRCQCTMSNAQCAMHRKWKKKADEWIAKNQA